MTQHTSITSASSSSCDEANPKSTTESVSSVIIDSQSLGPNLRMNYAEAHKLAYRLRDGMRTHIKDRTWHLKLYKLCFKASHAIEWSMKNEESEVLAVQRLNELISYGFLQHVVDPDKRIRVGETRTLYFRMVDEEIDEYEGGHDTNRASETAQGEKVGESRRKVGDVDTVELQLKLDEIHHILQETVSEVNSAEGKMEILQQQVLSLITNQMTMMGIIVFMCTYIIILSVLVYRLSPQDMWVGFILCPIGILIASLVCWLRSLTLWNDIANSKLLETNDLLESETLSSSTNVDVEGETETEESFLIPKEHRYAEKRSVTSMLSKSMSSLLGGRSLRRLSTIDQKIVLAREAHSLPNVEDWPNRPLLFCLNTPVCPNLNVPTYGLGPCPIGVPFHFESDLFVGQCLIRLKESNSDDPKGDAEYFSGRKRIFQSVIQGQFKEKVSVADVLTGHEFSRPLQNLPHPWVVKTGTKFIGKVAPGANIEVHTDQPHVEVLLTGSSQVIRGDMPGNEPSITSNNLEEDCSVLGGIFCDGNVTATRRKRLLSNPSRCSGYFFDCETVYTMEFYQNLFDASSYSLDLGFAKIGCSNVLNGQPIQWLGKLTDGRYLWSFQIWHEKLLSSLKSKQ